MLNIEILNGLNNWNYTLKIKQTASRWQYVTDLITESFIKLIRFNVWFIPEWSKWLCLWMGNYESLTH